MKKYIDNFLHYLLNIRGYSELSVVTYEIALRQMQEVSHFYEEDEVLTLDITPFRFNIIKNSKRTIVKKLSAIRSFIKYLNEQCNLEVKLIADDTIKVPQSLPKPIEQSYIEEVLDTANIEDKLIIFMLYGLGLRISELASLKLKHISKGWVQIEGKGAKVRELPLLETLQEHIYHYLELYSPQEYLLEKNSKAFNVGQIRYRLTKLFKASGLKVTPHQLRHSFATHLLNYGARISDVSELLGHKTMATTQIYTKLGSSKKMQEYMNAHPLVGI